MLLPDSTSPYDSLAGALLVAVAVLFVLPACEETPPTDPGVDVDMDMDADMDMDMDADMDMDMDMDVDVGPPPGDPPPDGFGEGPDLECLFPGVAFVSISAQSFDDGPFAQPVLDEFDEGCPDDALVEGVATVSVLGNEVDATLRAELKTSEGGQQINFSWNSTLSDDVLMPDGAIRGSASTILDISVDEPMVVRIRLWNTRIHSEGNDVPGPTDSVFVDLNGAGLGSFFFQPGDDRLVQMNPGEFWQMNFGVNSSAIFAGDTTELAGVAVANSNHGAGDCPNGFDFDCIRTDRVCFTPDEESSGGCSDGSVGSACQGDGGATGESDCAPGIVCERNSSQQPLGLCAMPIDCFQGAAPGFGGALVPRDCPSDDLCGWDETTFISTCRPYGQVCDACQVNAHCAFEAECNTDTGLCQGFDMACRSCADDSECDANQSCTAGLATNDDSVCAPDPPPAPQCIPGFVDCTDANLNTCVVALGKEVGLCTDGAGLCTELTWPADCNAVADPACLLQALGDEFGSCETRTPCDPVDFSVNPDGTHDWTDCLDDQVCQNDQALFLPRCQLFSQPGGFCEDIFDCDQNSLCNASGVCQSFTSGLGSQCLDDGQCPAGMTCTGPIRINVGLPATCESP